MKDLVDRNDAGARFSLYDSDEIVFDNGWYNVVWYTPPFETKGTFARPMREHSLVRLRSHGNQAMRLVLDGIANVEPRKGPVWLNVTLDGQRLGFFPVYARLGAKLDVPAEMLAKADWVDVSIQASYVTSAPGDGRLISYRLVSLSWEPVSR